MVVMFLNSIVDRWASRRAASGTEGLPPARFIANGFGGSHAQRDIIDWTLTEAALRGGYRELAEGLANERLATKPHSPVNRAFLNRATTLVSATAGQSRERESAVDRPPGRGRWCA